MMVMAEISPLYPLYALIISHVEESSPDSLHPLVVSSMSSDLKWGLLRAISFRSTVARISCSSLIIFPINSTATQKRQENLKFTYRNTMVAKSCSWKRWSLSNYFSRVSTYFNHPVGGAGFRQWIWSLKSSAWPSVLDLSAPNLEKWCVSVCHGCWTLHSESPCGIMWNCGTPKLPLWMRKNLLQSQFLGLVEFGRVSLWWIITLFEKPKALWVEWRH